MMGNSKVPRSPNAKRRAASNSSARSGRSRAGKPEVVTDASGAISSAKVGS